MPTLANQLASAPTTCNQRLLGTALAGLLCLATAGCSGKQDTPDASGTAGSAGSASTAGAEGLPGAAGTAPSATGGAVNGSAGAAGSTTSGGTSSGGGIGGNINASGGTAAGSGGISAVAGTGGATEVAGAGGAVAEPPHITSSTAAGVLTADDFKALCDQHGGAVEVMPHCGGFATAKGISYDSGTQLLSEHTCMGANTCGGWNCIVD